jgi:crotonobetainyl-CoA:carnitine CoA-transferase CaiB-like acyl-CoA transferase
VRHNRELVALLQEPLRRQPASHWLGALEAVGIPAGPVLHFDELFTDPHFLARGMVAETRHPETGAFRTLGVPVKLSETPGGVRHPAPRFGEHTSEVVAGRCPPRPLHHGKG